MLKKLFLTMLFGMIVFPKINFGQAPNLGVTSDFAVFTAAGAFDNTGATFITGNVGTNAGAFTGFPPGTIIGQTHVADSVSVQAAIDVENAYNELGAVTCDSVIGTFLGDDQVLTSNVYCLGALSTLSGNLILNGQGNPNAIFIFKINGAFSTSIHSKIILTDSASSSNIYWQINGAVQLGDSSVFQGSILANGAINLLEAASLLGRGLSRAGTISLHNNKVTIGTQQSDPLPIELLNFLVQQTNLNVQLNWSTATETNNNYFTVERSKDGITFEEVLRTPGSRNSIKLIRYSAIDTASYPGLSYYRLKQTDLNGKYTYSGLVALNSEEKINFNLYPNPFNESLTISLNDPSQIDNYELKMYNDLGIEVLNTSLYQQTTKIEAGGLSSGIYTYQVFSNNKSLQSGRLISQQ